MCKEAAVFSIPLERQSQSRKLLLTGVASLRFAIIPKMKVIAGIDIAAGKKDFGIYFRVGKLSKNRK